MNSTHSLLYSQFNSQPPPPTIPTLSNKIESIWLGQWNRKWFGIANIRHWETAITWWHLQWLSNWHRAREYWPHSFQSYMWNIIKLRFVGVDHYPSRSSALIYFYWILILLPQETFYKKVIYILIVLLLYSSSFESVSVSRLELKEVNKIRKGLSIVVSSKRLSSGEHGTSANVRGFAGKEHLIENEVYILANAEQLLLRRCLPSLWERNSPSKLKIHTLSKIWKHFHKLTRNRCIGKDHQKQSGEN